MFIITSNISYIQYIQSTPAITTAVGFSPMLGRPTTDRIEDNRRLRGAPVEAMWDSWSTVFLHAIYEYMKTTELTEFSTLSNFVQ